MRTNEQDRKSVLDAVIESIEQGGESFVVEQLAPKRRGRPPAPPVWLSPSQAGVTYRQVWTVRTASGAEVRVLTTSYRRAGSSRRAWFGLNIDTKMEVRIVRVLQGSGIG